MIDESSLSQTNFAIWACSKIFGGPPFFKTIIKTSKLLYGILYLLRITALRHFSRLKAKKANLRDSNSPARHESTDVIVPHNNHLETRSQLFTTTSISHVICGGECIDPIWPWNSGVNWTGRFSSGCHLLNIIEGARHEEEIDSDSDESLIKVRLERKLP